jgi:membrane protease YdiL (CAAX protease family)
MDERQAEPDPRDAPGPPLAPEVREGLLGWLFTVLAGGVGCTLVGAAEGAVLFALAGLFALTQASDALVPRRAYRHWVRDALPRATVAGRLVRWSLRALLPGVVALYLYALHALPGDGASAGEQRFLAAWVPAAIALCVALVSRRASDALARALFRVAIPTRTLRLTARLAVLIVLLCIPMQLRIEDLLAAVATEGGPLLTPGGLVAQLAGLVAIAFAGVGYGVRRDLAATLARLGVGRPGVADLGWVVLGVGACLAANAGLEWVERRWFPAWYAHDQAVVAQMAADIGLAGALLIGVTAGVGEEVFVRGALQPRLGLLLSNLLFAVAHVQYSWFGIATVAGIGLVLGIIRQRRGTTAAILVHALYNFIAAVSLGG